MDLRNTFISLTLLVAVGLLNAENDDQPPFILDFRRPRVMNTVDFSMESLTVSLRCRNNDPLNPEFIRDPTFWRHDREQPSITTKLSAIEGLNFVMSRDRTTVMFRLTRRFEGNYSCGRESPGVVQRSNTRLLVALPVQGLQIDTRPSFAKVGEQAIIPCAITPGLAIERYNVRWFNGSIILARFTGSNQQLDILDDRYSISPTNYSLIIDRAELEDDGALYRCALDVILDNRVPIVYPQSEEVNLMLIVYDPPQITRGLQPLTVVSTETTTRVTFECSANGRPPPIITWMHNGVEIKDGLENRYTVFPLVQNQKEDGSTTTSSRMTLIDLNAKDTGNVVCIASAASSEELGGRDLPVSNRSSSELIVLGQFNSLDVLISPDNAVIYKIDLPKKVTQTARLVLNYTNEDNRRETDRRITSEGYINTSTINHIEPNLQVPYERFRVQVGIMVNGVMSPLRNSSDSYDKTIVDPMFAQENKTTVIFSSVVPSVALVLIALFCCIMVWQLTRRCITEKQIELDVIMSNNETRNKAIEALEKSLNQKIDLKLMGDTLQKILNIPLNVKGRSDETDGGCDEPDAGPNTAIPIEKHETFDDETAQLVADVMKGTILKALKDNVLGPKLERAIKECQENCKQSNHESPTSSVSHKSVERVKLYRYNTYSEC